MNSSDVLQPIGSWRLADPIGLAVIVLAVLPWILNWRKPRIAWPSLDGFRNAPRAFAGRIRHLPNVLKSLAIIALAVALARPQSIGGYQRIASRGVALEVALDRSSSMDTDDYPTQAGTTSRLNASKTFLETFVEGRPDDLVGIVTFAGTALRLVPPTLDHAFVLDACRAIRPAHAGDQGTNLGHAIALGLGELRAVKAPKKVLILITDGRDEPPRDDLAAYNPPEAAARLAPSLGITIHTIAVGDRKTPNDDQGPDFERLSAIAKLGGGRAFVAKDVNALHDVFQEINALEPSLLAGSIRTRYREYYPYWIVASVAFLLIARALSLGRLRRIP